MVTLGAMIGAAGACARGDFLAASATNNQIVQFRDNGTPARTLVPVGSGGLHAPVAMTWGPDGNLYVSGWYPVSPIGKHGAIFVYDGLSGTFIRRFDSLTDQVYGLQFTDAGELLASDQGVFPSAIDRINPVTGQVLGYINGPLLDTPRNMLRLRDGRIIVGDGSGRVDKNMILQLDLSSNSATLFAQSDQLDLPEGMDYGPDGLLYVANGGANAGITRINPVTSATLGTISVPDFDESLSDLIFTASGNRLWASDVSNAMFYQFNATTGAYIGAITGVPFCFDLLQMPEPPQAVHVLVPLLLLVLARQQRVSRVVRATAAEC